jgi:UDP-N-acetylglucosamine 2-epimerase (non-hydrolysing)
VSQVSACLVAGARPNFMKVAPVHRALAERSRFALTLVHTGQHYDPELSDVFFQDLALPRPDVSLDVGSGSHAAQTARILERFEHVLVERQPDLVMVFGDINSTVACALATAKMAYPSGRRPRIAHVEAGLRSADRTMPEEINRILTDAISDLLFTSEESANRNLAREGIAADRVFFVGNTMIDTLVAQAARAVGRRVWEPLGLRQGAYAVATLHRPANVDDRETLRSLLGILREVGDHLPVVLPAHPRTLARIREFGFGDDTAPTTGFHLISPLGYVEFLSLMSGARLVLTDSGGIQEETTILGLPCLTLRENTERPITISVGTNRLVGTDRGVILDAVEWIMANPRPVGRAPDLWDGKAADRIAETLERVL